MKIFLNLFFILFLCQFVYNQEIVHLDENGKAMNKIEFRKRWLNKDLYLSRWDYIGKGKKRHATLKKDLYLKGVFKYNNLKKQLEKIIKRKTPDSSTFIFYYRYKDDLCNSKWDNKWNRYDISDYKKHFEHIREELKKKDIVLILLFEDGIKLKNKPDSHNEYFYSDEGNYFREKLFINPTLCGSYAIIKPNGQALIRNGEYRVDQMAEHIKPNYWNVFFDAKQ